MTGGAPVALTTNGGLRGLESPDGKSLLFTKPSTAGLWTRDFSTGQQRLLVEAVQAGDWTNWAVGLERVFFVDRDTSGVQRLVMVPFASGRSRVLASNVAVPLGTGGIAVSHDDRTIVFSQLDRREGSLYRLRVGEFPANHVANP